MTPTDPVTAFRLPDPSPTSVAGVRAGRRSVAAAAVLWLAAVAVLVAALVDHPLTTPTLRVAGHAVTGWRGDRLAALLAVLVTTVTLVVCSYATRYLRGDHRAARFFVLAPLTAVAILAMVGATTVVGLALGWTLSELGVLGLVGMYRPAPGARAAHRTTARAFALGDAALWIAVVLIVATWGNLDLAGAVHRPPAVAGHGVVLAVLAVLVPVAVAARCALAPLSRWLAATLAAPTPVSAFLHAGVVNAGGILLVRLAPVTGRTAAAMWAVFVLGAATVLVSGAAQLVEPSVKGSLVRSTSAQMGFMVACCGLGWYVAAILHLVAHGLYKSTLFLGSGAAVTARSTGRTAPPRAPGRAWLRGAAAALLPAVAVGWAWVHTGSTAGSGQLGGVVVLGWATAAWLAWGWLGRLSSAGWSVAVVVGVSGAAAAYVALARGLGRVLAPAVAGVPLHAVPVRVGLAAVVVLGILALAVRDPRVRASAVGRRAWVLAAGVARPAPLPPRHVPATAPPARVRPAAGAPVGVAA